MTASARHAGTVLLRGVASLALTFESTRRVFSEQAHQLAHTVELSNFLEEVADEDQRYDLDGFAMDWVVDFSGAPNSISTSMEQK